MTDFIKKALFSVGIFVSLTPVFFFYTNLTFAQNATNCTVSFDWSKEASSNPTLKGVEKYSISLVPDNTLSRLGKPVVLSATNFTFSEKLGYKIESRGYYLYIRKYDPALGESVGESVQKIARAVCSTPTATPTPTKIPTPTPRPEQLCKEDKFFFVTTGWKCTLNDTSYDSQITCGNKCGIVSDNLRKSVAAPLTSCVTFDWSKDTQNPNLNQGSPYTITDEKLGSTSLEKRTINETRVTYDGVPQNNYYQVLVCDKGGKGIWGGSATRCITKGNLTTDCSESISQIRQTTLPTPTLLPTTALTPTKLPIATPTPISSGFNLANCVKGCTDAGTPASICQSSCEGLINKTTPNPKSPTPFPTLASISCSSYSEASICILDKRCAWGVKDSKSSCTEWKVSCPTGYSGWYWQNTTINECSTATTSVPDLAKGEGFSCQAVSLPPFSCPEGLTCVREHWYSGSGICQTEVTPASKVTPTNTPQASPRPNAPTPTGVTPTQKPVTAVPNATNEKVPTLTPTIPFQSVTKTFICDTSKYDQTKAYPDGSCGPNSCQYQLISEENYQRSICWPEYSALNLKDCGQGLTCSSSKLSTECSENQNKCLSTTSFRGADKVGGKSVVCCNIVITPTPRPTNTPIPTATPKPVTSSPNSTNVKIPTPTLRLTSTPTPTLRPTATPKPINTPTLGPIQDVPTSQSFVGFPTPTPQRCDWRGKCPEGLTCQDRNLLSLNLGICRVVPTAAPTATPTPTTIPQAPAPTVSPLDKCLKLCDQYASFADDFDKQSCTNNCNTQYIGPDQSVPQSKSFNTFPTSTPTPTPTPAPTIPTPACSNHTDISSCIADNKCAWAKLNYAAAQYFCTETANKGLSCPSGYSEWYWQNTTKNECAPTPTPVPANSDTTSAQPSVNLCAFDTSVGSLTVQHFNQQRTKWLALKANNCSNVNDFNIWFGNWKTSWQIR